MNHHEALSPNRDDMTPVERSMHLRDVGLAWLNGEVSVEVYREAREKYGVDYRAAFQAIARNQRRHEERRRRGVIGSILDALNL